MNNAHEPDYDRLADECTTPPIEDEGPPAEYWQGKTGKWWIVPDWPMSGIWSFHHDDYDGAPYETGGPPMDDRAGHAASWGECVDAIRELEEDNG